jgi:hypothetical protein
VANEAKQWSDLYAQQYSQQRTSNISSSSSNTRPVSRKLLQAPKVPIRIWVEYQGTEELSAAGQQRLREVVGKAVAVLQKFYKVRCRPAITCECYMQGKGGRVGHYMPAQCRHLSS